MERDKLRLKQFENTYIVSFRNGKLHDQEFFQHFHSHFRRAAQETRREDLQTNHVRNLNTLGAIYCLGIFI